MYRIEYRYILVSLHHEVVWITLKQTFHSCIYYITKSKNLRQGYTFI